MHSHQFRVGDIVEHIDGCCRYEVIEVLSDAIDGMTLKNSTCGASEGNIVILNPDEFNLIKRGDRFDKYVERMKE